MTATEEFIKVLEALKPGDLGLLRAHTGKELDETVGGFDLFAGLWWPLREKSPQTPRRSVAWLIAKLYAFRPLQQSSEETLARRLRNCEPRDERDKKRFRSKFDELLLTPLDALEPALQWALGKISSQSKKLDWVQLTDDLSIWDRGDQHRRRRDIREVWAEEYLNHYQQLKEK